MEGYIFNVQHFSVHDGPGIRTIVFMKGCPLHCKWCSNPESHKSLPEIAYNPDKCIGESCKRCLPYCPQKAINWNDKMELALVDFNRCNDCLNCAKVCPSKALSVYGKKMSAGEVVDLVDEDLNFYSRSGGGITLSGGEPLLQRDFALAILKESKARGIHTAMETTGYGKWDDIKDVLEWVDYILIDLKHTNEEKHRNFTGVSNQVILENLVKIREFFPNKKMHIRTPVIPGFNDSAEELAKIREFIDSELTNVRYELLKYHSYGKNKYAFTGRCYPMHSEQKIEDELFATFKEQFEIVL